jgi:hypothetical protein
MLPVSEMYFADGQSDEGGTAQFGDNLYLKTKRQSKYFKPKDASRLLVLRLVCLCKCGRFHEPEPKQRDQLEPCARAVRYSVGTVSIHCRYTPATVTPSLCTTSSLDAP